MKYLILAYLKLNLLFKLFLGLETNVIPEEVDIKMIRVNSKNNDGVFEIFWEPVKNVNHGLVSYTVKVLEKEDRKIDSLVSIYFMNIAEMNLYVLMHNIC